MKIELKEEEEVDSRGNGIVGKKTFFEMNSVLTKKKSSFQKDGGSLGKVGS